MKALFLTLVLLFTNAVLAQNLDCSVIEKHQDDEGNFNFFRILEKGGKTKLSKSLEKSQIRIAVKNFYGTCGTPASEHPDFCYRADMTDEEVSELGEGVYVNTARAKDKKTYTAVNVGFGGGNSAQYLFNFETLEILPFFLKDSAECLSIK